jgi:hypothetical protein
MLLINMLDNLLMESHLFLYINHALKIELVSMEAVEDHQLYTEVDLAKNLILAST